MKKVSLLISAIAMLLMTSSCGSSDVYPQNEGGGKAVKAIIEKNFDPEKQVQELQIKSKEELYGDLGKITIVYWEGDKQMEQEYSAKDGLKDPEETFAFKNKMTAQLQKTKTLSLKDFDLEPIPNQIGEAVTFIPADFENYAFHEYTYAFDKDGKATQKFTINTTKKGEGKSQNGRMVSQNYYSFNFKVEGGKVVLIEK